MAHRYFKDLKRNGGDLVLTFLDPVSDDLASEIGMWAEVDGQPIRPASVRCTGPREITVSFAEALPEPCKFWL